MGNIEIVPDHSPDYIEQSAPINYNYQTLVEIGKLEINNLRQT